MFDNQDSTEVKSIKFSHLISDFLVRYCRYEEDVEIPVRGEKFSPFPGWNFQLEIFKMDDKNFRVCLQNLTDEEVDILSLSIMTRQICRRSMNSLSLKAGESFWVATLKFSIVSGFEMEIEAKIKDQKRYKASEAFLKDFEKTLDDPTFADTTLVCEGVEIPCHRVFLAAKSEVFRTMFSGENFIEGRTHKADIVGVDLPTLKEMLSFIYTANFDPKKVDIGNLFAASNQYMIYDLRQLCEDLLVKKVSTDNAIENYLLASLHKDGGPKLKEAALSTIANNLPTIRNGDEWAHLKEDPDWMEQMLIDVVNYTTSKRY